MGSQCCQKSGGEIDEKNFNSVDNANENIGLSQQKEPPKDAASPENDKFATPIYQNEEGKTPNIDSNLYNQYFASTNNKSNEQPTQEPNIQQSQQSQQQQQANQVENPYAVQNENLENKNVENNNYNYNYNNDAFGNVENYTTPAEQYNLPEYPQTNYDNNAFVNEQQVNYENNNFSGGNDYQYGNYQENGNLNNNNDNNNNYAGYDMGGANYF